MSTDPAPVPFGQLRPESQQAVLRYMQEGADDGEFDPHEQVLAFVYIERDEPVEQVQRRIASPGSGVDEHHGGDFDDYHRWFLATRGVARHTHRWPAIRGGGDGDDYLQDGWHRLHSYLAQGDRTIPTVELVPADS